MKMGKVNCIHCNQYSVRNIYNKCVYCGHPFESQHHVSESERTNRLSQIEETNELLKQDMIIKKERDKQQKKEARRRTARAGAMNNHFSG